MKIHLAIFDPSHFTTEGAYWSWRSPKLDIKLLNQLYYEVAALNRPEDPNQLSNATILGGFAPIGSEFVFVYRFGNGGYDSFGRPGRFVMVVAGFRLDQTGTCDVGEIVSGSDFSKVIADAKELCPVPEPPDLEIDMNLSSLREDPQLVSEVLREKRLSLPRPTAPSRENLLSKAAGICMRLPGRNWQCKFQIEGEIGSAEIEYIDSPSKILPTNSEWKADSVRRYGLNALVSSSTNTFSFFSHFPGRLVIIIFITSIIAACIASQIISFLS